MATNRLFYGDNLDVLRHSVPSSSVDLVYLDPPFNSQANYNVLFREQSGDRAAAQIRAFEDTWRWDEAAVRAFKETVEEGGNVAELLSGMRQFLGDNDLLAYLAMMAPRLLELHRVLRDTGSIFLHCDQVAGHYLKLLLDAVFGAEMFRNEVIWRRTGSNSAAKRFGPLHQSIFYYTKTDEAPFYPLQVPYTKAYVSEHFTQEDARGRYQPVSLTGPGTRQGESGQAWGGHDPTDSGRHWQPASYLYSKYRELAGEELSQYALLDRLTKLDEVGLIHWPKKKEGVPRYKYYLHDAPGTNLQDLWGYQPGTEGVLHGTDEGIDADVKWLGAHDAERLSYPTQKPEGLLNRIIRCATQPGDVVLDPFCGCGTTVVVAHQLRREWVGIDITHLAIGLMKHRLKDTFGDDVEAEYEVHGEPVDVQGARFLAEGDRYQFEWWALGLVGARRNEKKGADKGVDGVIWFHDEAGRSQKVVLQVKSGKVGTPVLKEFRQTMEAQSAVIGVFLTLEEPSKPMRAEAAEAGTYTSGWGTHPKIQLLSIAELLEGARIDMPPMGTRTTFRRAARHVEPEADEPNLFQ